MTNAAERYLMARIVATGPREFNSARCCFNIFVL
jgi:hypothetical protein